MSLIAVYINQVTLQVPSVQLDRIEGKLDTMSDTFDSASAKLDAIEASVAGIESDDAARDAKIAELKAEITAALSRTDMTADEEAALLARIDALGARVGADDAAFPVAEPPPTP